MGVTKRFRRGDRLDDRIARLEADVAEMRRHNLRLAELTDVVQELLLPVESRDQQRIDDLLEKYSKSL